MLQKMIIFLLVLVCLLPTQVLAVSVTITNADGTPVVQAEETTDETMEGLPGKDALINDIIAMGESLHKKTGGRLQRAQYSGDIYVCKNFTVHLFRENAVQYRMAEFPDTELIIPNNKPKKEMVDYVYGVEWETVAPSQGNPFYVAASFRYDPNQSKAENQQMARQFLQQVQKGDYFQMAAKYYYGVGAHSMIFTEDYQPETDTVIWMDSNMKGESRDGVRYGVVQFDAEKPIDWFVDAFCRNKYGATLYRLRDDIIIIE